ncbi:MAG: phosphonate ABC transporter ATP-binding protein [Tepidisphaera sp.]|nr:phosphonate ABC transporter ATP-binding protein [Tepidisphaera sp.]
MTPHDPILCARNIGMIFPGGTIALDGVSVDVGPREFLVILGSSGAGKSTLLRMFNRLGTPTSGSIIFRGRDITHAGGGTLRDLRRQVGMVFQQFNLVGRLSVLENVLCGRLRNCTGLARWAGSHARWFSAADREAAMAALTQVGVAHLAGRRADALSGGQQQRVAIARTLAQAPSVVLADEPIASLDPKSAETVMDILRDIHIEKGLPVVANLHQVDVALRYATRIVGMRAGKIVFSAAPAELDASAIHLLYQGRRHVESAPEVVEPAA